jgi:hypothetical protein
LSIDFIDFKKSIPSVDFMKKGVSVRFNPRGALFPPDTGFTSKNAEIKLNGDENS